MFLEVARRPNLRHIGILVGGSAPVDDRTRNIYGLLAALWYTVTHGAQHAEGSSFSLHLKRKQDQAEHGQHRTSHTAPRRSGRLSRQHRHVWGYFTCCMGPGPQAASSSASGSSAPLGAQPASVEASRTSCTAGLAPAAAAQRRKAAGDSGRQWPARGGEGMSGWQTTGEEDFSYIPPPLGKQCITDSKSTLNLPQAETRITGNVLTPEFR